MQKLRTDIHNSASLVCAPADEVEFATARLRLFRKKNSLGSRNACYCVAPTDFLSWLLFLLLNPSSCIVVPHRDKGSKFTCSRKAKTRDKKCTASYTSWWKLFFFRRIRHESTAVFFFLICKIVIVIEGLPKTSVMSYWISCSMVTIEIFSRKLFSERKYFHHSYHCKTLNCTFSHNITVHFIEIWKDNFFTWAFNLPICQITINVASGYWISNTWLSYFILFFFSMESMNCLVSVWLNTLFMWKTAQNLWRRIIFFFYIEMYVYHC